MEKKIKQLLRYLQIEYVAVWVLPLLLVALYETGVMTEGLTRAMSVWIMSCRR